MNHNKHLLTLITIGLLSACGAASAGQTPNASSKSQNPKGSDTEVEQESAGGTADSGSYITYLRSNHDHYSDYATTNPYPVQLTINGDQVYWDIQATSEADADILSTHIGFMGDALENGQIPRDWDKLFVLEAFLHEQIHTEVTVDGTRVTIYKTADNDCAYSLVKTHAAAVSNEFFATGDISTDHSGAADEILAQDACSSQRDAAYLFIEENWSPR